MSFDIQQKIKQNALEIREYVTNLYDWEKEMELKDKVKTQLKKSQKEKDAQTAKEVEIRKPKEQLPLKQVQKEVKKVEKPKELIRDKTTVSAYYNAWDKYDADKQLEHIQEVSQHPYRPYNPYEDSKNNLRAKPKTKINVTGKRSQVVDPTELKDKGNLHFQCLEYEKAINCYTECLNKLKEDPTPIDELTTDKKKLRCVVLSNRAMAYLKINESAKALDDASLSLTYDGKYAKSYYRRAECYKKLHKYMESLRDYRTVKKLEPNETKADAEIKRIEAYMASKARQLREKLVIPYNQNLFHGGRKIDIEEVDFLTNETEKVNQSTTNYLEEL